MFLGDTDSCMCVGEWVVEAEEGPGRPCVHQPVRGVPPLTHTGHPGRALRPHGRQAMSDEHSLESGMAGVPGMEARGVAKSVL